MNRPEGHAESVAENLLLQKSVYERRFQAWLDEVTPYTQYRWIGTGVLFLLFLLRVILAEGWYIVTYALGIYILNLFLAFLSPKTDPALDLDTNEHDAGEGPSLPLNADEEFKPFTRRLPEFKFWIFDIPVYWPILLVYFCILFGITMRRQIKHMIKYKYIPFDWKKKTYKSRGH